MKRATLIFALFLVYLLTPSAAHAHPGNTNSSGCHTQSSTGDYHCHDDPDSIKRINPTGNYTGEWDSWTPPSSSSTAKETTLFEILVYYLFPWNLIALWVAGWWVKEKVAGSFNKKVSTTLPAKPEPKSPSDLNSEVVVPLITPKPKQAPATQEIEQQDLSELIIKALASGKGKLKAREIKTHLNKQHGLDLTRKEINQVLYGKLASKVRQNDKFQWELRRDVY